jgi:hypothetical protein
MGFLQSEFLQEHIPSPLQHREAEVFHGPKYAIRLGDLQPWHVLKVMCFSCRHVANVSPAPLLARFGQHQWLIDYLHDQRRYRYRLVGSNIITATGENRTGRYFDEFGFFRDHPGMLAQYETVVSTRRPLYSLEPFTNFNSGSDYDVDRLILPLSEDDQFVDTFLVLFQFNSGPFAARLPADLMRTMFHRDGL